MTAALTAESRRTGYPGPDVRGIVQRVWKPAVLAAFACWLLAVGMHHEAWVDESQAWLLARDNSLLDLLFRRVRYEGSPGLWHVLLWLCIKAGLPFGRLYLVSTFCAIAGAAIILWRSPFPAILRVALIASYFPAYQYSVVARSYALDLLLVPLLANFYDRRAERPGIYGVLVGLLANCNAHSFVASAVLGCEFLLTLLRTGAWRTRQAVTGLCVAMVLGLFALFSVWPPADSDFLSHAHDLPVVAAIIFFGEAFIDRLSLWDAQTPSFFDQWDALTLSLMLLVPSFLLFFQARMMPLAAALFAALIGFSTWGYSNAWHAGLLFLFWFFLLWTSWHALSVLPILKHLVAGSVALLCAVQAIEAVHSGLWDVEHPYSAAPQAAGAVAQWREAHPAARIAAVGLKTFAMQPFFSANIFANYHAGAPEPAYIVWTQAEQWKPYPSLHDWEALPIGGFDLLIASTDRLSPRALAEREALLSRAGYQLMASYPGAMEWKGYQREDDSLLLFTRADIAVR